jgi:hypothetical protein
MNWGRRHSVVLRAGLVALALLSGCREEKKTAAPAAAGVADNVLNGVEQAIRAGVAPHARFRGVQVYSQALPQRMAVCGQLDPFANDPELFVPFVSIVSTPLMNQTEQAPEYQFEHHIGTNTAEASRVYAAIVTYCYDKGGPTPGPLRSVLAPPPLPDSFPDQFSRRGAADQAAGQSPSVAPVAAAKPAPATSGARLQKQEPTVLSGPDPAAASLSGADAAPAEGSVTMRQNGNLHADPLGPTIRVVPQGTTLRVFAQAPGGWYQVGDTTPWGWVHESMLNRQ